MKLFVALYVYSCYESNSKKTMKLHKHLSLKEFSTENMEKLGYVYHNLSGYKRKTYFSPPFITLIKNGIEIHSNLVGKDKTIVRIEE